MKKSLLVLAGIVVAALALYGILRVRAARHAAEVEARATRAVDMRLLATYEVRARKGWERPVLRGEPQDRNAAKAQLAALDALDGADPRVLAAIAVSVRDGTPLSEASLALIQAKGPVLAALRRATQGRFAFTHADFQEKAPPRPVRALVDTKLLLGAATREAPAECLRIAADAIRLAQDRAPGELLVSWMVSVFAVNISAPLIVRCGEKLDAAERAAAVGELRILAEHAPSFGEILDNEWFFLSYEMIHAAPAAAADGMRVEGLMWDGVDRFVASPPDLVDVDAAHYPEAFKTVARYDAFWSGDANPLLQIARVETVNYAHQDARAQATLRALVVTLELQGEGVVGPRTRAALDSPTLRDPFTGVALRTEKLPDGGVRVSSPGAVDTSAGPSPNEVHFDVHPTAHP
jgi:hypothetical protein